MKNNIPKGIIEIQVKPTKLQTVLMLVGVMTLGSWMKNTVDYFYEKYKSDN